MQCELCGNESFDCRSAIVDGVKMMLCPNCVRYGEVIKTSTPTSAKTQKPLPGIIKKPVVKDVYVNMNKELVSDWNEIIKKAREKKGLTREELGFRIGERTVAIAKMENGDLRPSDKTIEKLEKELGIKLIEEVRDVPVGTKASPSSGLTLGDFFKKEE